MEVASLALAMLPCQPCPRLVEHASGGPTVHAACHGRFDASLRDYRGHPLTCESELGGLQSEVSSGPGVKMMCHASLSVIAVTQQDGRHHFGAGRHHFGAGAYWAPDEHQAAVI